MLLRKLGGMLCLIVALSTSACRTDKPPAIEICTLDGFGGGDCIEADGSKLYRPPSQMTNYWATNGPDEAKFAGWCYNTSAKNADAALNAIQFAMRPR